MRQNNTIRTRQYAQVVIVESGNVSVSQGYEVQTIPLGGLAGKQIQIRFCLISDESEARDGIYLDDLLVHLP